MTIAPPDRGKSLGLTGKQGAVTLLVVLLLGLLVGGVESVIDWRMTRSELKATVAQTLEIVRGPATEAAFQIDPGLAVRVSKGLFSYEPTLCVVLSDNYGRQLTRDDRTSQDQPVFWGQLLFGDVTRYAIDLVVEGPGLKHDSVGRLEITLSANRLAHSFLRRAAINAVLGLVKALAICVLVVLVFFLMITRPLVRLSQWVSRVDADHPGAALLPAIKGHEGDELGTVVTALNDLLRQFQRSLDQRETLAAENLRLGSEVEVSRKIQQMILPTAEELGRISCLDVATHMEPAHEVGGDYYDIVEDGACIRIGIGDVTGHGLESGMVMLMTQSAVRTLVTGPDSEMKQALAQLNHTIFENVQRMGSDKHLTLALLEYRKDIGESSDGAAGHLRIGGQHESLIIVRAGGALEVVETMDLGMPIGLIESVDQYLATVDLALYPGDMAVLYTDGVTEAADSKDRLYGFDRFVEVLRENHLRGAAEVKDAVVADIKRHTAEQPLYDDVTLIVMKQR